MNRMFMFVLGFTLAAASSLAAAETLYVTDRLAVPLLATPAEGPALRTLEAGSSVEVLERGERFVRVRSGQGAEGWMDARYLVNEPAARAQLARLNEELTKARRELTDTQTRLKKAEADLGAQAARAADLGKQLASAQASQAEPPVAETPRPVPVPEAAKKPAPSEEADAIWQMPLSLPWLLFAFAMLGLGFASGVRWLRESIKRRSGGMYLRL